MKKEQGNRDRPAKQLRTYLPIIVLLVLGVSVSFVMFWRAQSWEYRNQRKEFESWAKAHADAVENTLNQYIGALLFLSDYFDNSSLVTRKEFTDFAKSVLPRYPGIQALEWLPLVRDDERRIYESNARKEGYNDFDFTERSETNTLVRATRREKYVIVYYLYPLEGNMPAFGYDIASNSTRLRAIKKAFNTGKLSATDRITLVQETGNQFGILLLNPIYHRKNIETSRAERQKNRKGFVVEVLRVGKAVETALENFPDEGISLTLYDISAEEGNRFLYHRPSRMSKTVVQPIPEEGIQPGLFWSQTFNFAERQWKIVFSPSDFYYQSQKRWQAGTILFGSLLLTMLLALYMFKKTLYTTEIEHRVNKQVQTNQQLEKEIRERKQKQEALRQSEEKYRHLFETAMVGIYRTRIEDGKFLEANQVLAKMLGYESVDRLVEEYITSTNYTDPELRKELINQLQSHGRVDGFEIGMMRNDGSTVHIALSATAYPGKGYLEGFIVDITKRKQAEAGQRESEQKFRALVEQSPLGISLIDKDGRYQYVNFRFQELFGYTLHDCPTGKEWFEIAYPDKAYRQKVMESWVEDYNQTAAGQAKSRVYAVTCKDGSRKEIHFRLVTMDNRDQFVVYEDITERSQLERHLQQAQKMEAIGTLAGGIAHDFNNLLMGIQGRASLISADLEQIHPHQEHTNAIEGYIRSATDLTKQLLGLARGGKYEVKPTDANELVRNSSDMFGRTKKEIRIHTNFYDTPPVISVDRNQIEQVLLNLYINAWQAMSGGGDLYLETQIVTLDRAYCEPYRVTPGHYAKISVTDTGIGMDSVTAQLIFDPFFTTKEKGRGTGLGLASAYGIIKNHDGIIIVDSNVGQGTTFNIYLPISEKEASRELLIEEGLIRGSETVLLIDDEEMILEVGQAMLEKLGYQVFSTPSGEKAIEMVKRKENGINMVILDLIMPGMDGGKVFDGIREILPQIPVMLSSGYAINGQADKIMQRGCNGFIQKPFNLPELSRKIRQILDETKFKD